MGDLSSGFLHKQYDFGTRAFERGFDFEANTLPLPMSELFSLS